MLAQKGVFIRLILSSFPVKQLMVLWADKRLLTRKNRTTTTIWSFAIG
jgi:hypothetical protein